MWFSFFIFSVLTALLPGPNNILALNSTMTVGYKQSRWLLAGIYTGFTLIIVLSAILSEVVLQYYATLLDYLKILGALYLIYLAWSVSKSKPLDLNVTNNETKTTTNKSDFWKGFLLQLVNVKIIIYGITVFSNFIYPNYQDFLISFGFTLFLSVVGCTATWIWAVAGEKLSLFLNNNYRIVNGLMGVLLLYCAISLFI